jgi:hypothetical protein
MTCTEVCGQLPVFVYGDLPEATQQLLQEHLAQCAACQQECAALRQVRQLLDSVPAPSVQIDPVRIQQEAMARQEKRLRRWRRTAWAAVAALAATVLVALLPALEIRLEGQQLVLRWGNPPPQPVAPLPSPAPSVPSAETLAEMHRLRERLEVLAQLVNAMDNEFARRDRQRDIDLERIQTQLATLQLWVRAQIAENEKNLTALYHLARKGENP